MLTKEVSKQGGGREGLREEAWDMCGGGSTQRERERERSLTSSHLGLPLHPGHRDAQQQHHRDAAHDPDVVHDVDHEDIVLLRSRTTSM
ncbi:hypothetical protein AAFF_G00068010 [Aldrovandia affinis]|uniref:Uncharacterized protein n=1 Tax=Aldrovandia affinis TaxID=143900 RepID=A0AAD7WDV3_9TELE|nr:hypothetical protein AAFF_G00068010 [Aldrovandia affinis]